MKPIAPGKDENNNIVIVAFDIESKFVKQLDFTVHEPDLLCALIVCNKCYKRDNVLKKQDDGTYAPLKDESSHCSQCLAYRKEFVGRSCVKDFTSYVYDVLARHVSKLPEKTEIRVFAHNFKGYDGRFILRDLFNRDQMESQKLIMQGSKISCLKVANVTFQDSLNLFQCALSKLPKSFQFEERVLKGTFPYLFNTPEHAGYVGATPAIHYYGYENMKPGDQEKLQKYHNTIKDRTDFDLEKAKLDYCRDDTEILLIALQEFRRAFEEVAGFDPIRYYFTLPSMSYGGFRRQFLQPDTIGITPVSGYGQQRKNSMFATSYLDLLEKKIGRKITREHRIGYAYADGFDEETKTIYEINGCHWHGCLTCHPFERDRKNAGTEMTYNKAYELYTEKMEFYNNLTRVIGGLSIVSKWECEIRQEMRQDRELRIDMNKRMDYYRKLQEVGGCDLRDSYFGGRTNNRKFFGICDGEDEWFEYVDFTR
jgi:G:T-mismatch repair DNA endonuclease (very short patch repair protein)